MTERLFFFNVHIPKCGGTTFQSVLKRNFGRRLAQVYAHIWEDPYTAEQLAGFVQDSVEHTCLSSHRLSLNLPFDDDRFRAIALILVRDPIRRFLSHYHYHRSITHQRRRFSNMQELTAESYAAFVIDTPSEHYLLNYQYWSLTQNAADASLQTLQQLCDEDRAILLPLERFDDSLLALRGAFPEHFRRIHYAKQNVSRKDSGITPQMAAKLRAHMTTDYQLYAMAERHLAERLQRAHPDAGELERERRRLARACRRHRMTVDLALRVGKRAGAAVQRWRD